MIDLPPEAALVAETPRLRLMPVTPDDAEEMFAVLNDQRLHRYIGGLPPSQAELAERYRALESRRSADGSEVYLTWVVRLVPLGEAIGEVRAAVTDDGTAALWAVIGHRYRRHGFATEAVVAMVRMLSGHVEVATLEALIPPGHRVAQTLATGLGMIPAGRGAEGWDRWTGETSVALERAEQRGAPPGARAGRARRRPASGAAAATAGLPPHGTSNGADRRRRRRA